MFSLQTTAHNATATPGQAVTAQLDRAMLISAHTKKDPRPRVFAGKGVRVSERTDAMLPPRPPLAYYHTRLVGRRPRRQPRSLAGHSQARSWGGRR